MISPSSFSDAPFSDAPESSRSATSEPDTIATANPAAVHDAELVRRFNTGDEDAFVEIVGRHRAKMFSIAFCHLHNHADAEEIAQDAFIRAHRGLANFRGDSSLSSWLYRIVINLSRNRYGYFSRRHRQDTRSFDCTLSDDSTATFGDLVASDMPDPARAETNREFLAHVSTCMEKLSARQREILTLRNLLDHSYEEIGKILGLSTGTVKSRIARARKNLRGHLAQAYGEPDDSPLPSFQWFGSNRPTGRVQLAGACS